MWQSKKTTKSDNCETESSVQKPKFQSKITIRFCVANESTCSLFDLKFYTIYLIHLILCFCCWIEKKKILSVFVNIILLINTVEQFHKFRWTERKKEEEKKSVDNYFCMLSTSASLIDKIDNQRLKLLVTVQNENWWDRQTDRESVKKQWRQKRRRATNVAALDSKWMQSRSEFMNKSSIEWH